ncbi:single-stranded DNA-binding protein [bacterium]|nr:single-stranded DNA-binding protein [bacterium]MBU1600125.1 single-stranded DNA-binding protein [bacterium]MBU2461392.1 single-stranded DNA-binding protein [bacterium]
MRGYSKAIIMGNLTRDPELRYIPSGTAVANFTVAINRTYKDSSGETREETSFLPVVVWGKQAENCNQYLKKGKPVFIDGDLRQRSWEDKEGQKRSIVEIHAFSVQFLYGKPGGETGERTEEPPLPSEEDVPF